MTNGYENAPATKMLATHCACCGRPLVDATSVETGVGPECRKRHGFDEAQGPANFELAAVLVAVGEAKFEIDSKLVKAMANDDARSAANSIVYRIAVDQDGPRVAQLVEVLRALGYTRLADRIVKRVAPVSIAIENDEFIVRGPYTETAVAVMRNVAFRRWDRPTKTNRFPLSVKGALWHALRAAYPGVTCSGPKGLFTIQPLDSKEAA